MQTIDSEKIPHGFAACPLTDCELSGMCLRSLVYATRLNAAASFAILNPTSCTPAADCPQFRSATPVRFARGLRKIRARMFPAQYASFRNQMCAKYGKSGFYRRLNGEVLFAPADQKQIAQLVKNAGVDETPEFDSYEIRNDW